MFPGELHTGIPTAYSRSLFKSNMADPIVYGRYIPALSALARFYASKCKIPTSGLYFVQFTDSSSVAFPPHTVVSMPALSPTMTAGNIGTWQKKAGDAIAPGDVLVEIETDKAQMDFEFQEDGVLAKILKDSGEKDVAVGNVGVRTPGLTCAHVCVANCCHD